MVPSLAFRYVCIVEFAQMQPNSVNIMKTVSAFVPALLLAVPLSAQETLIGGDADFGGFGGPAVQFTSINKQFGLLAGGVIIDHTFVIFRLN